MRFKVKLDEHAGSQIAQRYTFHVTLKVFTIRKTDRQNEDVIGMSHIFTCGLRLLDATAHTVYLALVYAQTLCSCIVHCIYFGE